MLIMYCVSHKHSHYSFLAIRTRLILPIMSFKLANDLQALRHTAGDLLRPVSHSRFSPTPSDSVLNRRHAAITLVKLPKKITSHRQPKDPSTTGIPLKLKFKTVVSV